MPRTYIGPFGRILPVPDDREPERQQVPDDETRTNMATYQLPPPDQLQFGSDGSPGFTEPERYNTVSQPNRSRAPSNPMYAEQAPHIRYLRHEQLPSLKHLLTPSTGLNVSQSTSLTQHTPNPSQSAHGQPPDQWGLFTDQSPRDPNVLRQSTYSQPPLLPPHVPPPATVNPPRETYQSTPPAQQLHPSYMHYQGPSISPYAPSFEPPQQMLYSPEHQQAHPPSFTQQRQTLQPSSSTQFPLETPLTTGYSQQLLVANPPVQYSQDQASETATNSAMASKRSPPASANNIKPLPRVIGEQDVPGEGPSWVYEDGTTCKKTIDGEAVNAQWGITKAGKPRKRLAIACTICREKKIKCDPAEPKCVQCEKFGRECKFTTA